ADKPGTGDTVDLGARARHPDGAALAVAARQFGLGHQRQARLRPGLEAVLEPARLLAAMPAPGGRAVAELQAALTDDDGRRAAELAAPALGQGMRAPDRAWNEARIGGEILIGADIDEMRAFGHAHETGQFIDRNGIGRWH